MSTPVDRSDSRVQPTEDVTVLNRRLVDYFGKDQANYPKFRLVWSTDQRERRFVQDKSVFTDYGLFLRYETGWVVTEKYPLFQDKWILEELMELHGRNPELPYHFSYEPIWVFGNGMSNPVPNWKAIHLLVKTKLYVKKVVQSPSDIDDEETIKLQKEIARNKDILQNESPYLAGALHDGAAVVSVGTESLLKKDEDNV
jgi:hypothetical protein